MIIQLKAGHRVVKGSGDAKVKVKKSEVKEVKKEVKGLGDAKEVKGSGDANATPPSS